MVHVSTGSVYGDDGPDDGAPLPEDGYVRPFPVTLYPVTKLSGELLANRWRELFGLPLHVVRLASVYGPMDRPTPGRDFACAPHVMVHKALRGEPWSVAHADGVGDFIHAADVADAICDLLAASRPFVTTSTTSPLASRQRWTHWLAWCARSCPAPPGMRPPRATSPMSSVLPPGGRAPWGAYDISRIVADVRWRPRPLRQCLSDYAAWITDNESDGPQRPS